MKTLLITGGTGDLGAVVVPRLLRDYRCAVVYRSEESFRQLAPHENLVGLPSLEDAKTVAPLHGVVMLAGGFSASSEPDDFAKMFDLNVMTAVRALHAARPHLADDARVVAVGSAIAITKPPGLAAYTVSKAALGVLIEVTAKELKERGITANAVLPNAMDTPSNAGTPGLVPRARVAETIAFLLSGDAANVTGQWIALT